MRLAVLVLLAGKSPVRLLLLIEIQLIPYFASKSEELWTKMCAVQLPQISGALR